ncbi:MAG: aminopeptidase P family protein [Lachnospiraceae bacterium]|nr:aminopeptidase P family protein [Lachnospiraceae bacterium]
MIEQEVKRCGQLRDIMMKHEIDGVLISNGANMRYISGFCGGTGYLLITKEKQFIFTDSRYTVQAKEESNTFQTIEVKGAYVEAIEPYLEEEKVKKLGYESKDFLVYDYQRWKNKMKDISLVPLEDEISMLRAIKNPEEINKMRQAEKIGDMAFEKILNIIKPGMTELQVAAHLEFYMKEFGAEGLSFDTIVASGINSSKPHAIPGRKVIEKGDFITMDFGCIYEGYCSDMTRTIVVGKANERQKEIYQIVLEAQLAALDFIKAGYTGKEIDRVARDIIQKAGYGNCFGHGLGHSVGLFIHENPRLSPKEDGIILENMIETVEPGIYVEGFAGVRIEDMVLVTKNGCENLTQSPKQLIEL